jgi:hypothetical protein
MAAGKISPKILTSLTAMMLDVIKDVMKMETTSKNHWEYRPRADEFCFNTDILL